MPILIVDPEEGQTMVTTATATGGSGGSDEMRFRSFYWR